jgi:hypothetical protein
MFRMRQRLMGALSEMSTRDVLLAIDQFELTSPNSYQSHEDLVEKVVLRSSQEHLEDLAREVFPDALPNAEPFEGLLNEEDNSTFSKTEQEMIAEVLNSIKTRLDPELPEAEQQLLAAKIDYLIEAAHRSRRRDWLNIAYGALASSFAGGVLTPDTVHKVLVGVVSGVGHLFGTPLLQLPAG